MTALDSYKAEVVDFIEELRLRRWAREWTFRPARDENNRPVAVKYPVELDL